MSRIDSQLKHQDLFGQKKDSPPGLWDPLAGLFKKKVPPSIPEEPVIALPVENIPNGINEPILEFSAPSKVPVSEVSLPLFDEVSAPDFRATPEVPILDAPRSLKENIEILSPVGAESEIQTIAINAIEDTPMNTDAVIKATITTLTPIANPQTLPVSFSRKASSLLTLRNFSYLALLITAISFIYFLYTKLWKKNPTLVEEIPTINQPVIEEKKSDEIQELSSSLISEEVIVEEEKVVPTESQEATTGQKITAYEWLNPSQGVVGGIIGGILGFFLSKFTEQRNSRTFQEELFKQADLRYAQVTNQYVTLEQSKAQFFSILQSSNLSKEQQALSEQFDELREEIQKISNQLITSGKPRCIPAQSDLQNQLSDSQNGTNVKEQYEKIEQTISQLESRFSDLQESQRTQVQDLRKKLETLLSKEALEVHLKSIRNERSDMFVQLSQEINAMQEKAGSKDGEQVRHLQELKDQLGRLARQMGDFNPKDLLEKFDQLKAGSSKDREEAISQLKQVVHTQITENRNSILSELRLEISNIQKSEGPNNDDLNRELQALKEQLGKLSSLSDFNPKDLLEKFDQLKAASSKERKEAISQLKQEVQTQITDNRNSILSELRLEISNIQNREGSKNETINRELQALKEQLGKLSSLSDFNPKDLLEKFEQLTEQSEKQKVETLQQLRQEIAVQLMQAILQIRQEFDSLNIENREEISALAKLVERNFEFGFIKFEEIQNLAKKLRSQDNAFVMKAIEEQNTRFDMLQAKTEESISKQLQEIRTKMKAIAQPSDEQSVNLDALISQLESRNYNGPSAEMTKIQWLTIQEEMKRGFDTDFENAQRLELTKADKISVLKNMLDLQGRITKLRTDHEKFKSSHDTEIRVMMRGMPAPSDSSPNRSTSAATASSSDQDVFLTLQRDSRFNLLIQNLVREGLSQKSPSLRSLSLERIGTPQKEPSNDSNDDLVQLKPDALGYCIVNEKDVKDFVRANPSSYGMKEEDKIVFIKNTFRSKLISNYLNSGRIIQESRGKKEPMSKGAGLHPNAVQNLAGSPNRQVVTTSPSNTPNKFSSTTPGRRLSIASNNSEKNKV